MTSGQSHGYPQIKMNSHKNFRCLLISLLLTTCLIGEITSVPIDSETKSDSGIATEDTREEILSQSESKLEENVGKDSRGLNIPFLSTGSDLISGKENSGSSGLPGFPDLSSATAGAKVYLGTFQVLEAPMPSISNIAGFLGNFGNFGNAGNAIKPPTIPGLSNLIPSPGGVPSTS